VACRQLRDDLVVMEILCSASVGILACHRRGLPPEPPRRAQVWDV